MYLSQPKKFTTSFFYVSRYRGPKFARNTYAAQPLRSVIVYKAMNAISVKHLSKSFRFPVRTDGRGFFANLLKPEMKTVDAVKGVSFSVKKGERIACIGPNGAGKSTTIKMLTGILYPTAGEVEVLGLHPQNNRRELAYKIGTVFGQRSQLYPNLPITSSLEFFGVMYDLTDEEIKVRSSELVELFDLDSFKDQPVRKLSLGQRMRAEIACSLIHRPEIIFLDEPTIGLDVVAKHALRDILMRLNTEQGTTIFLTSHDVGDIEALCERTIVINHGEIVVDEATSDLVKLFPADHKDTKDDTTAEHDLESVIKKLYASTGK
jgi:ABC-2 type transport system ATP-binding protein